MTAYHRFSLIGIISVLGSVLFLLGCAPKQPAFIADGVHCQKNDHCSGQKICIEGLCKEKYEGQVPSQRAKSLMTDADNALAEEPPNCETALRLYDEALAIRPEFENKNISYNRGLCYIATQEPLKALPIFENLYKADKDNEQVVLAYGRVLVVDRRYDSAIDVYRTYLAKHPRAVDVRANLATVQRITGKFNESLENCRELFLQDPAHPGAFNNMALIFYEQGKIGMAKMIIYNGIAAQKNVKGVEDPSLYVNLGVIQLKQGDETSALSNFKRAVDLDPGHVAGNMNLGALAMHHWDYTQASESFEMVLRWDPQNTEAKFGLAIAYRGLGKYPESLALYKELYATNKKDPKLLWNMGVLYFVFMKDKENADIMFKAYLATGSGTKVQRQRAEIFLQEQPQKDEERQEQQWVNPVVCVQCKSLCADIQPCTAGEECPALPDDKKQCEPCRLCPTKNQCVQCRSIDCTPKECTDESCPEPPEQCPTCAICDGIREIECQLKPESCGDQPPAAEQSPAKEEPKAAPAVETTEEPVEQETAPEAEPDQAPAVETATEEDQPKSEADETDSDTAVSPAEATPQAPAEADAP